FHMVDLAGEAVGRQPFGHGVGIEEGTKQLLRLGGEDTMQTDGVALGHDAILSIAERSLSHDFGWISSVSATRTPGLYARRHATEEICAPVLLAAARWLD